VESIEASGKSVEEAIQQALMRLGKLRNEVDIAVLQEPSRGIVGLGSRDARVRVTVRPTTSGTLSTNNAVITPEMADAILGPNVPDLPLPDDEQYEDDEFEEEEYIEDEEGEFEEEAVIPFDVSPPLSQATIDSSAASATQEEMTDVEAPTREDVEITVDILQHILRYMSIRASVQVRSTNPLTLNIQGINENLGLLIGRRGETLAALQLLVGLIFGHRTKRRIRIVIDAENYRERREANLRSLALRVAQQVRNYRRSIALEAMPPHERRIVHIALSDSKDISTESIGEGEERRVVISLKRPGR
jgi:spoIIIJ-associated protein